MRRCDIKMERLVVGNHYLLRDDMSGTMARVLVVSMDSRDFGDDVAHLEVQDLDRKPGNVYAGVPKLAVTQRHGESLSRFSKYPITVNVRTVGVSDRALLSR
jgi:hypothetical protein